MTGPVKATEPKASSCSCWFAGLFIDYFDLHRIRDRLPVLKGEGLINPLTGVGRWRRLS